jgi:hypothetical protein
MPRTILMLIAVAIAGLALSLSAWGQATTSLQGTVTDPSGAAITQAQMTLTNIATNFVRQTTTTTKGGYEFVSVLPGTYKLTVEAKGFRTYLQTELRLLVDLPSTADARLQVGASTETMEVRGEAPPLNTTDPSIGHTMGEVEIENLPLQAESMPLLLSLQPGVVYNGEKDAQLINSYDTRAGSVNGERSDQNNITLDGVSINDEFNGYAFTGVLPSTPYSVEEFRVTTSNYGATDGRSAGAQISMVTKGGTNVFHGSLYEFNRNTAGEANDYFLKSSQLQSGQPNVPEHLVRNIFGGTIGGPMLKNRLFFFFNYEGTRQSRQDSALRNIPTASLSDGIIQYECDNPSLCPGGSVTGMSGASYPVQSGYYALNQPNLIQMDPLGAGPNQAAVNYLRTYPVPNDYTVGNLVNTAGYRFAAPTRTSNNWYIGRLDYNLTASGNHTLFLRGAARNDRYTDQPFLPGAPPQDTQVDVSKGFVAGYTGVFGPHWVNNVRYGLTHQSIESGGDTNQPWVSFRGIDQPITYPSAFTAPVHNLVDTVSWLKGSHNFQFGGNLLFIRRNSFSSVNSFSDALTNADWIAAGGFANKNDALDPAYGCSHSGPCFPAVAGDFNIGYDWPLAAMMGIASEVDARYNFHVDSPTSGTALDQGAPVTRHWSTNTINLFFQDTWHVRPHVTLTYGLNYQLMTPITETAGQEVAPSVNMGSWFNQRAINMAKGIPSNQDALISFAPSGSSYGRSGLYGAQTRDFAPRVGLSWSPQSSSGWLNKVLGNDKTVVRAGFGMYYDNFGPALAMNYDANGSFGLSTVLSNPSASLTLSDAPRITDMNVIPTSIMPPAPPSNFPVTFPLGSEAIASGIDQSLKSPYSFAVDFSIQRQLPGRMTLDVAYVGHFAHRLLALDDVAAPMNLVDPKSGIDYFSAAKQMSKLWRAGTPENSITPSVIGLTAQYWQNMLPVQSSYNLCSTGGTTPNLLVATYDAFSPGCGSLYNETTAPWIMDLYSIPSTPVTGPNSFFNSQYSSLWDWRSIGYSNYNALQVGLHKQMSHGVVFGLNYTYSKSNDIASQAERGVHYLTDSIINPWSPNQMYAPSDFDLRHQINGYWVAELPFGRGKRIGGDVSNWADAVIGGWQLGGTARWTSGYVTSVFMGYVWPTNWDEMGWADLTGKPIATGTTLVNGTPNVFKNPSQASNGFDYAYPGESGSRNNVRGDGYLGVDMNLAKTWKIPRAENQSLQFRWSVFNVTNTPRFDVYAMQDEWDVSNTFGNYTQTLTKPRVMEFALTYKF